MSSPANPFGLKPWTPPAPRTKTPAERAFEANAPRLLSVLDGGGAGDEPWITAEDVEREDAAAREAATAKRKADFEAALTAELDRALGTVSK